MLLKSTSLLTALALLAPLGACADRPDDPAFVEGAQRARSTPQLNLSHIACAEDGSVEVHFVLLFAGDKQPGLLTFKYNEGESVSVEPGANTGNVWHYTTYLKSGWIDVTGAEVKTASGDLVSLHNPGEYEGYYECAKVEACHVAVTPQQFCLDNPLGNEGAECGYFGLDVLGKDDGLSGTSYASTRDAYVAIVKAAKCYQVFVDVAKGDTLESPWVWSEKKQQDEQQDISHVTYCACPKDGGQVE